MPLFHPPAPILVVPANGRKGAYLPIRRVVSDRLQSAESGRSIGTAIWVERAFEQSRWPVDEQKNIICRQS
jgi:hypothetical protein